MWIAIIVAVLLIAAALEPARLGELARLAQDLEMDVLIEVHDRAERDAMIGLDLKQPVLLGMRAAAAEANAHPLLINGVPKKPGPR